MAAALLPIENNDGNSQIYYILDEVLKSVQSYKCIRYPDVKKFSIQADYVEILFKVLYICPREADYFGDNQLYESDCKDRQHLEEQVLGILRTSLSLDDDSFELKLIGSSKTELDTKKSDVNFSLVFTSYARRKHKKFRDKIATMNGLLKDWTQNPSALARFYNVSLTETEGNPKYCPRLKFKHVESKLACDLAISDNIGEWASKLMSTYAGMDERVPVLCHSMKHLSRIFKIDASSASDGLSRYAYMVMVIFFLQRTVPPVLPVLHQMHREEKPREFVDGCDVWFCQEPPRIPTQNNMSAGELWLGMLNYFGNIFKYKEYIVSITTHAPKTQNGSMFSIEDPLDHKNYLSRHLTSSSEA